MNFLYKCLRQPARAKTILLGTLLLFTFSTLLAPIANADSTSGSGRAVQVDLSDYAKISQYTDIDASYRGYGPNACGLVAAAAALGGQDWTWLVAELAEAAGSDYSKSAGIQPSDYVAALREVLGSESVTAKNASTLEDIFQQLQAGNIVIVDVKVNANTEQPSSRAPNYAHFARVLGIDLNNQEIYIENTLSGAPYWTVSFQDFLKAWDYPETSASLIPDSNPESVTRWMVNIDHTALVTSSAQAMG